MQQSGFNPKARWDRFIPEGDDHNTEELNDRIDVLAWFRRGKIYPKAIAWKEKLYPIQKITYNWQERCGAEMINYFSVDTGCGLYQISFNNTTYGWKLDKIISLT